MEIIHSEEFSRADLNCHLGVFGGTFSAAHLMSEYFARKDLGTIVGTRSAGGSASPNP